MNPCDVPANVNAEVDGYAWLKSSALYQNMKHRDDSNSVHESTTLFVEEVWEILKSQAALMEPQEPQEPRSVISLIPCISLAGLPLEPELDFYPDCGVSESCRASMQKLLVLAKTADYWMLDDADLPIQFAQLFCQAIRDAEVYRQILDRLVEQMPSLSPSTSFPFSVGSLVRRLHRQRITSILSPEFVNAVVSHGHLSWLKCVDERCWLANCSSTRSSNFPCPNGRIHLQHLGHLSLTENAASNGHTAVLAYLHEHGGIWNVGACTAAAKGGHLECLAYLHRHGCPWDTNTCTKAASRGRLDCLEYLHRNGCPWDQWTLIKACKRGQEACVRYAAEHGCPWSTTAYAEAAQHGHLAILQYAFEKGYVHTVPWDERTCSEAAQYGQLACLQYAHEHGCPWNAITNELAAEFGHLDCLRYTREHGCVWGNACNKAARGGHLECLKYAHEHGCSWSEWTCIFAARGDHIECLQYAVEHGCRFHEMACRYAEQNGSSKCLAYISTLDRGYD